MNKNINLYPRKNSSANKKKKIEQYLRVGSLFLLVLVSFGAIVLFFLQSQSAIPTLQDEEKSLLTQLSAKHSKTAKYMLTNERLKSINDITNTRYPMDELYSVVTQQLPAKVALNGFSVEKQVLVISTSSSSLGSLNTMIDNMTKLVRDKKFLKKLTLNSLGFDYKTGSYSLGMEAEVL